MPEGLAEVYRSTYRSLVRFLYRKVWDAERAEDLAQEAFARALVHKPENARGWLFVVAANMARDEARKAARERRHLTLLKSEPDTLHTEPEDQIDAETRRERVRTALDQLTSRDREALPRVSIDGAGIPSRAASRLRFWRSADRALESCCGVGTPG